MPDVHGCVLMEACASREISIERSARREPARKTGTPAVRGASAKQGIGIETRAREPQAAPPIMKLA
jgi:hypothetical protein